MKPLQPKIRRELVFVLGATLLALVPLAFLWIKSVLVPKFWRPTPPTPLVAPPLGSAILSPDGRLFARMEPSAKLAARMYKQNERLPAANEVVIRSAQNAHEVFRIVKVGGFVGWQANSRSFVTRTLGDISVFIPPSRKAAITMLPSSWKQKKFTFSLPDDNISHSWDSNGGSGAQMEGGSIEFSPDYRFAVKAIWDGGTITWEVADLQKNKMYPQVRAGRWLGYDPRVGGGEREVNLAIAPASVASGNRPVVAVLQNADIATQIRFSPKSTPTPLATATPAPTPTYSATQIQIKAKEDREEAAIQKLVESVLGVDGADPEVTDEAEIKRIDAEVKRRNIALEAERKRFFPRSYGPLPTPEPTMGPWALTRPIQVETFDLNTGKRLWSALVKKDLFVPQLRFSPDGSSLITWGTAALHNNEMGHAVDGRGVEFRSALTGRLTGKTTLFKEEFGIPKFNQLVFYADTSARVNGVFRSILVLKDSYLATASSHGKLPTQFQGTVFRLYTAMNGREVSSLKLKTTDSSDLRAYSIAQGGQIWLLNEGRDVSISKRGDLGRETRGPLPEPTLTPTPKYAVVPRR